MAQPRRKKKPDNRPTTRFPRRTAALALCGGAAVAAGLFGPAARVDFYGTVRLWDLADRERWILLAAALVCLHSAKARRQRRLAFGAALLWAGLFFPAWSVRVLPDRRTWVERLGDRVTEGFESTATDVVFSLDLVHYAWGLWTLLAGCVLVTFAGMLALRRPVRRA